MKTRTAHLRFLAIFFVALIFSPSAYAFDWVTLKPNSAKKYSLTINGKKRVYYRLRPGESMTYNVNKLDKIRIITRADLRKDKSKESVYTFRFAFDTNGSRLYARATSPDHSLMYRGKTGAAGEDRSLEIVPLNGTKELAISLGKKASHSVFFRVQREHDAIQKIQDYVAITPKSYQQAVGIDVRENISTYYSVDKEQRLSVAVNGPTTLKILTRVVLKDDMRGKTKFPLAVYEDGTLKNTIRIETSASEIAEIVGKKDDRLSRGDAIYVEVPKGHHRYSFSLPENHNEAILRFFIPEKDLKKKANGTDG
jgi:hypothetical protein